MVNRRAFVLGVAVGMSACVPEEAVEAGRGFERPSLGDLLDVSSAEPLPPLAADPDVRAEVPTNIASACWSWAVSRREPDGELALLAFETRGAAAVDAVDQDANGVWDHVAWTFVEPDGSSRTVHDDGDGVVDQVVVERRVDGLADYLGVDEDGDGVIDRDTWFVIEGGRVASSHTDADVDGVIDEVSTHTYDALDRLIRVEADEGVDGTIDSRADTTWTGLPSGGTSREDRIDVGADGTIDMTVVVEVDGQGRQTLYSQVDASLTYATEFEYGAGPDRVRDVLVVAPAGSSASRTVTTWTWEAPGRPLRSQSGLELPSGEPDVSLSTDWLWTCP